MRLPIKRINLPRLARAAIARWAPVRRQFCVACGRRVGWFLPYKGGWKQAPALMRVLDVIGSDLDHFECPACGASDRERHLLLYMQAMDIYKKIAGRTVVHFAPEHAIQSKIMQSTPARYIRCDLWPQQDDVERVDMLEMPFADASVDLLLANHVLEHVADDLRAVAEVRRVLKPGGLAILQTPYSAALHATWKDDGIDGNLARLQAYGQEDHVRLYGRDIIQRFASSGLEPRVRRHPELLADCDPQRYGINAKEPFFLFASS